METGGGALTYPQLVGWQLDDRILLNVGTSAVEVDLADLSPELTVRHLHVRDALAPRRTTGDLSEDTYEAGPVVSLPPLSLTRVSSVGSGGA